MSAFMKRVILVGLSAGLAVGAYYLEGPSAVHLMTLAAGLGVGAGAIRRPGDVSPE